jgi:hypothetical protein
VSTSVDAFVASASAFIDPHADATARAYEPIFQADRSRLAGLL